MFIIDWLNTNSGAVQAIAIVVLVGVTWWYAKQTKRIAEATNEQVKAAKEQADASVKMAEEMRKQRLMASLPLLFPDFKDATFPEPGKIWFVNLGNGPALDLEITIAYSAPDVVKRAWLQRTGQYGSTAGVQYAKWSIVTSGRRVSCRPELSETQPGNIGTAFVEYSDIYGTTLFLGGWGYRCEKDSKGDLVLQPTEPIYPIYRERGEQI